MYLQKATNADFVDWAFDCLEEGFDSKSLRLLAGLSKDHNISRDFDELFEKSLNELGWRYLSESEVLPDFAKDIAKSIISGEQKAVDGVEMISDIHFRLGSPKELEIWMLLEEGHSDEWYDPSWIPFLTTFNYEKWHEVVMREAKELASPNFKVSAGENYGR